MLDQKLLVEIQEYINSHHLDATLNLEIPRFLTFNKIEEAQIEDTIEDFIQKNRKPTFKEMLFQFIDKTGETDAAIYNRAGIDRKLFSKIRNNNYHPGKNTILALALALELDKDHTNKLLNTAGYSLSNSDTSDLIIQFCLEKKIYNIHLVNQALDYFHVKPL